MSLPANFERKPLRPLELPDVTKGRVKTEKVEAWLCTSGFELPLFDRWGKYLSLMEVRQGSVWMLSPVTDDEAEVTLVRGDEELSISKALLDCKFEAVESSVPWSTARKVA